MKTSVLMLGCLLATASLAQSTTTRREVWEWKDANGVTHFSDYPAPGARKIVLVGSTPTAVAPSPPAPSAARPTKAPAGTQYTNLQIWSPQQDAAFFGADAEIVVRIRSEPELGPGDRLLTYLDGKRLEENAYEHRLTGLPRGAHALTASIVNSKGVEVIRSTPVTFFIQQPSTIDNARNQGPSLRPPQPKPAPKPTAPKG
jgi:hypothetical protein